MSTVLSLFLFVAAIAYVEYRLKRINAEKDDNSKEAFRFFATKEELKSAVKRLTQQMTDDRTALDERMTSVEQKAFFAAEKPQEEVEEQPVPVEEADPSVVFFRWPADDGTFDDAQRQKVQTEDTYYRFQLDDSRTHGEFTFVTISDTQISKANNSSKKYIERACNFVGTKSSKYICKPGKAHLERGRWLIDLKARIEYC
jgi:hypothetical protein